jgi:hypothetical protein
MVGVVSVVDQEYILAPLAVRLADVPEHMEGEFTTVAGLALMVIVLVAVAAKQLPLAAMVLVTV